MVALKVKLGLAEAFAEKDPARAKALVGELKSDADEALETLRDLARGIYPPLLADKGLVAALESQARKATLPVQVDAAGVGRYPQEVEAAVYFCCLEALQNVQKYAAAQLAVVKLDGSGSELTFEVTDDGRGFDDASVKRGAGLTNMTDRIDAGWVALLRVVGRPILTDERGGCLPRILVHDRLRFRRPQKHAPGLTALPQNLYNPAHAAGGSAEIPSTLSNEFAARCANGAGLGDRPRWGDPACKGDSPLSSG